MVMAEDKEVYGGGVGKGGGVSGFEW